MKPILPALELPEPENSPTSHSPQKHDEAFHFPVASPVSAASNLTPQSQKLPGILRKSQSAPSGKGSLLLLISQQVTEEIFVSSSRKEDEEERQDDPHRAGVPLPSPAIDENPPVTSRHPPSSLPGLLSKQSSSSNLSELDKYLKKKPVLALSRQESVSSSSSSSSVRPPPLQRQGARRHLLAPVNENNNKVDRLSDSLQKQLALPI